MLISEYVKIYITRRNITHFKNLNYDVKVNVYYLVKVSDLIVGSPIKITVKCDLCGKVKDIGYRNYIESTNIDGYYCCNKCRFVKIKSTKKENYNNEYYNNREKAKNTFLERYGVEHVMKTEKCCEQVKKTKLEKYGDEYYNNHKKGLLTKKERYGDKLPNFNKDYFDNITDEEKYIILEKKRLTRTIKILEKYKHVNIIGVDYEKYEFLHECSCGYISNIPKTIFYNRLFTNTNLCLKCHPINTNDSDKENQVFSFIKTIYDGEIIRNSRKILKGKELDIFLPDKNLAVEFNGLFWHNEMKREKFYHKNKTDLCLSNNIDLFHIYEDDWCFKQNIVEKLIYYKIYPKTNILHNGYNIKFIKDYNVVENFINNNSINIYKKCNINIGLYIDNEMYAVLTLKKYKDILHIKCIVENINSEYANLFELLLIFLKTEYKPKKIYYNLIRGNESNVFLLKNNFKFHLNTEPTLYFISKNKKSLLESKGFKIYDSGKEIYKCYV